MNNISSLENVMIGCSVLMPVFNTEKYLAQAIESILSQTYTDFELIIINDGSTDNSETIVRHYERVDNRVRVFTRKNQGVVSTRNELLQAAESEYLAWMDSDDVSHPNRLELQVREMDSHPDLVAVGGQAQYIDFAGRPISIHKMPCDHGTIDRIHMSGSGHAMLQGCAMVRRKALIEVGSFDNTHIAEDIELWLRLAEYGQLENIDSVLLDYRLHPKSYGHTNRSAQSLSGWTAAVEASVRRGVEPPPRPQISQKKVLSNASLYRKWSWWALADGNISTARCYAWRAIVKCPLSFEIWKLLACTIRGY
ncbi:MAG: glycosyltransferase family 2 protein [Phycisphaerales bacterium]|nr:glycosyltransferase family 2 protein [Phycisphaerales bacterium]